MIKVKVTARSMVRCELVLFPISPTGHFWYRISNVYTSYKGRCQDPDVDLDLKVMVTQQKRSKQALVDDLWH